MVVRGPTKTSKIDNKSCETVNSILLPRFVALAVAAATSMGNLGRGIPSSESETRTSDPGSSAMDHPKEVVEMDALPEGCVAHIISLTTPRDAARSSAVSRAFRSASDSDAVWREFLPPDLDLIVSTSPPPPPPPLGPSLTRTKDVFLRLCGAPLLIDSGRKSFALEKWSGKKCYMIGSRDLGIIWGWDPRYWRWSSLHVSRFPEVAELIKVCWLQVILKMETRLLSANTYYAAYFIFKFVHGNYGFENQPVEVSISSGYAAERRIIFLDPDGRLRQQYQTTQERCPHTFHDAPAATDAQAGEKQIPRDRGDGWKEVDLGEFFVSDPPAWDVQIELMEVKTNKWKSGLVIEGIELRPLHR